MACPRDDSRTDFPNGGSLRKGVVINTNGEVAKPDISLPNPAGKNLSFSRDTNVPATQGADTLYEVPSIPQGLESNKVIF